MQELHLHHEVSQFIAKQGSFWTQGAGGNVSILCNQQQRVIKRSGFRLDAITNSLGAALIHTKELALKVDSGVLTEAEYSIELSKSVVAKDPVLSGRPSMEGGFHVLFPHKIVAHFHSVLAIVLAEIYFTDLTQFQILSEKFLTKFSSEAIVIDFVLPGLQLAEVINKKLKATSLSANENQIIFLRNHGVIIGCHTILDMQHWLQLETQMAQFLQLNELEKGLADANSFLAKNKSPEKWKGPLQILFPDAAIMLKELLQLLENNNKTNKVEAKGEVRPKIEMISSKQGAFELWQATCLVQRSGIQVQPLSQEQQLQISGLPTEVFRKLVLNL